MNKQEFLGQLSKELLGLPQDEIDEQLEFYSEMIEDRKEEGLSEEEAIAAVGTAQEIVTQVVNETPFVKIAKEGIRPKRMLNVGEILLLALGSPIWLSLAVVAFAVILSLYISLWSLIVSLWLVFVSLAACSVGGMITCIIFALSGRIATGIAILAAGIVCAGLSIFMFYGCKEATKGIVVLTKKIAHFIKKSFIKKGE